MAIFIYGTRSGSFSLGSEFVSSGPPSKPCRGEKFLGEAEQPVWRETNENISLHNRYALG